MCPYPYNQAPSQRFRFEQYFPQLRFHHISYTQAPFIDTYTWSILYKHGHHAAKIWGIIKGFLNRFLLLFTIPQYDFVFIHREASPVGPPVFEWIIAKVLRAKIIYDFDDAIWIPNTSKENSIASNLKANWKVKTICRWAYKVSAGNQYLCEQALMFRNGIKPENVIYNPTTVDTQLRHNQLKVQQTEELVIGWTGTHSTLSYLDNIIPVIAVLQKEYNFRFVIICNTDPKPDLTSYRFIPWKEGTEIADLLNLNIGIMPLTNDAWAEGKCGFKAIQYMALGIPALVSPVGVNKFIVDHGINGYHCITDTDWSEKLKSLLTNAGLRMQMGLKARAKIVADFSASSNEKNFIQLFT